MGLSQSMAVTFSGVTFSERFARPCHHAITNRPLCAHDRAAEDGMGLIGQIVWAVVARLVLFALVVSLVWVSYVWLYAYRPDTLGWIYAQLRPVAIGLYQIIDTRLPEAVKYKASAGLSDELGPRAMFLLILGGVIEAIILAVYGSVMSLVRRLQS
jgi:hypothetical protein